MADKLTVPAPLHAHVNLVGWTSLVLMGLTFRAWPELATGRRAVAQFALSTGSASALLLGLYLALMHEQPGLAIVAGILWFIGALLFLARLLRLSFRRDLAREPAPLPAE